MQHRTFVVAACIALANSTTRAQWTCVSLHPVGALESQAYAAGPGQQVGSVNVDGRWHASMWTGSAASWVDLNPVGAIDGAANGVYGGRQVGRVNVSGFRRASLWAGSAVSWVDLSAFLPTGFTHSEATAKWSDESSIYIVGFGENTVTNQTEALLWVSPIPIPSPPCADVSGDGIVSFVDITSILANWDTNGQYGDADHDGDVDFADITRVLAQFGSEC